MIFFSLEDYIYNITPVKRWGFLIIIILFGSFCQYKRFVNNYFEQKLAQQRIYAQQMLINKLKNILAKKNLLQEYCDFYKLDYAELKILLAQIANSNNYIKNIIIEPDSEKILLQVDLKN
jgi:hypothetical protein